MCYLAKHQLTRAKLIDILADQKEASWENKAKTIMKHVEQEDDFETKSLSKILQVTLENIEEHEEELGYTQKMRYQASRIADVLFLGEEFADPNSAQCEQYYEEIKKVGACLAFV